MKLCKVIKFILFYSNNVFHKIFKWSILIIISSRIYDLLDNWPEIFPYAHEIYLVFQLVVDVINVVAVALVGAVAFFYIQEYRTYLRNKGEYIKIENCLSAILCRYLSFMNKNFTFDNDMLDSEKIKDFIVWGNYKNGSKKMKYTEKILNFLSESRNDSKEEVKFNLSDKQVEKILKIDNIASISYETLKQSYDKIQIPFEDLDEQFKEFFKSISFNKLSLLENKIEHFNFIRGQIFITHLKNIMGLYIELLKVMENPKLNIFTRL